MDQQDLTTPLDSQAEQLLNREKLAEHAKTYFSGFSKLTLKERLHRLKDMGALDEKDFDYLKAGSPVSNDLAEKFIENTIGFFKLPIGVATNFVVDGRPVPVPMAVEETSIIAAASKTAKWVRESGSITTEVIGKNIIGQVQFAIVKDPDHFEKIVDQNKVNFINLLNEIPVSGLFKRGGGVTDIQVRRLKRPDAKWMMVVHIYMDPCDAMGANIMNQACEYLKGPLQDVTGETATMCILSNLVDSRVTQAKVVIDDIEAELAHKIEEASLFSWMDPYRAATNNKGILNGIDPILIATGNDWRAVEAGIHAYAARDGQYRSVSRWVRQGTKLVGTFEAPLIVGIVGGVTKLHPMAQVALRLMSIENSDQLSRICAAVGLVQNLGALKALTTEGIIEGHMKLHIKNLTLGAGAQEQEIPMLQRRLEEVLALTKRVTLSNAIEILRELRAKAARQDLPPS